MDVALGEATGDHGEVAFTNAFSKAIASRNGVDQHFPFYASQRDIVRLRRQRLAFQEVDRLAVVDDRAGGEDRLRIGEPLDAGGYVDRLSRNSPAVR